MVNDRIDELRKNTVLQNTDMFSKLAFAFMGMTPFLNPPLENTVV